MTFNARYLELAGIALTSAQKQQLAESVINEAAKQITEGSGDVARGVEDWMEATKTYHFEGARGVRSFESLIRVIGYSSLDGFLEDNPGCLAAMVEWIGKQKLPEWSESFAEYAKEKKED